MKTLKVKGQKSKGICQGQALVSLLFFIVMAVTIISGALIIFFNNTQKTSVFEQGLKTYSIAESGAENAILRLLRNPNYTGETMTVDSGSAVISVSGSNPKTIISEGRYGNYIRRIQVNIDYTTVATVSSWREI